MVSLLSRERGLTGAKWNLPKKKGDGRDSRPQLFSKLRAMLRKGDENDTLVSYDECPDTWRFHSQTEYLGRCLKARACLLLARPTPLDPAWFSFFAGDEEALSLPELFARILFVCGEWPEAECCESCGAVFSGRARVSRERLLCGDCLDDSAKEISEKELNWLQRLFCDSHLATPPFTGKLLAELLFSRLPDNLRRDGIFLRLCQSLPSL